LTTVEKQIAEKFAEIRVLKQYRKSMEIAMRLKQKVEGKPKPERAAPEKSEPGTEE